MFWMTLALARSADPDLAYHFHDSEPVGEDVTIKVVDAWARPHEAKAKVIIENDSPDFLIVRTQQMMFSADEAAWGDDEVMIVPPRDRETNVVEFAGKGLRNNGGAWFVPGGLYRVPTDGAPIAAPNFELPLAGRSFDAGPFSCTLNGRVQKETDETSVRFRCTYEGDGMGLVDISAVSVIAEGQEFATIEGNGRLKAVKPGDSFKLKATFEVPPRVADMQFAPLTLHFNDTFREGIPQVVGDFEPIPLDVDWKKTH